MPAITALITLNSFLKSVLSYRYFFTLGATFTTFLKLILDNPFQTRMVAEFYKGFIHSFFSLRQNPVLKVKLPKKSNAKVFRIEMLPFSENEIDLILKNAKGQFRWFL